MAKRKRPKSEEELAWERGFPERMRNLRELAEGRARPEWLVEHGLDPETPAATPPVGSEQPAGDLREVIARRLTAEQRRRFGFPEPR
jgi:hypothetical protein